MSTTRAVKRLTALIMVLIMLCTMAACNGEGGGLFGGGDKEDEATGSSRILRLAYSREDGLNPFAAKSLMNKTIVPLIFSGLFSLPESYKATPDIASSVKYEGTDVIVTLNSARRFSDGSVISADDVVYSFELAKNSEYYATMLSGILSAEGANSNTVVFKTPVKNVYAASDLIFPIVKQNSVSGDAVPIGAGPYVYKATADGGELSPNKHYGGKGYAEDVIVLENVSNTDNILHSLIVGNVDAVFDDLSGGELQRINAASIQVDLNNLVFLGINPVGPFAKAELRSALGAALDKEALVSAGLEGYGAVAATPFNPAWHGLEKVKVKSKVSKDKEGYIYKALAGYTLTILVNSDNNFKLKLAEELCSQLNKMGVSTKLSEANFAVYKHGIEAGNYNIYVGEYKLTPDMNITSLISDDEFREKTYSALAGNVDMSDYIKAFNESMPFIPIAYRTGLLAYSRSVETEVRTAPENVFVNLTEWSV